MNVNCMICTDLFTPTAEVYATTCGHMFHYACLMQWIERSKTCPQCRCKVTEKTMHRIFFNTQNTDSITEDVGTLQNQVDNLNFQLRLRDKDVKIYTDKYQSIKNQNVCLRDEVKALENKMRVAESAIHAQKQQTLFYKKKYQEMEQMGDELQRVKDEMKNMNNMQLVLHGTREQVANMLMQDNNKEALCLLVNTLKKELVDVSNKNRQVRINTMKQENEISTLRKELEKMKNENKRLINESQINWQVQMKVLKNKIVELEKQLRDKNANASFTYSPNDTVQRIITESPAPLRMGNRASMSDLVHSPTLEECVKEIENSESPYLPVKSSSMQTANLLKTKYTTINLGIKADGSQKPRSVGSMNYLLKSHEQSKLNKDKKSNPEVSYNGLGGHSKVDTFPTPKSSSVNAPKRVKSSSYTSTKKFKKLSANMKLEDFTLTYDK